MFFTVSLAISLPRFKEYSYIMLVIPTYWLVKNVKLYDVFVIGVIFMFSINITFLTRLGRVPIYYYQLMLAYALWLMYVYAGYKVFIKRITFT